MQDIQKDTVEVHKTTMAQFLLALKKGSNSTKAAEEKAVLLSFRKTEK